MADQPQQQLPYRLQQHQTDTNYDKNYDQNSGPSTSKVLVVATLFPLGGTLLALAGLSLVGTLIGVTIATPLFLLFSPVLVPAAFVIGCSMAGFLTSGAFGITGFRPSPGLPIIFVEQDPLGRSRFSTKQRGAHRKMQGNWARGPGTWVRRSRLRAKKEEGRPRARRVAETRKLEGTKNLQRSKTLVQEAHWVSLGLI